MWDRLKAPFQRDLSLSPGPLGLSSSDDAPNILGVMLRSIPVFDVKILVKDEVLWHES